MCAIYRFTKDFKREKAQLTLGRNISEGQTDFSLNLNVKMCRTETHVGFSTQKHNKTASNRIQIHCSKTLNKH